MSLAYSFPVSVVENEGSDFSQAVENWNKANADWDINLREFVGVETRLKNRSINVYGISKTGRVSALFYYVVSERDVTTGHVRLISFSVRDLSRVVNNRRLDDDRFRSLRNPLAVTGRLVAKFIDQCTDDDVIDVFCRKFAL